MTEDEQCHAINAGWNAADQENNAEERQIRDHQKADEFLSKIKIAVNRRHHL